MMSNNFNWQTDEDVLWDDEAMGTETAVPRRRRPWVTLSIIALTLVAAGFVLFRQVNERVESATADIKSDILAAHNLVVQASLENDAELFATLLSGRSESWSNLQTEGVQEGWLYERATLDLRWLPPDNPRPATLAAVESGAAGIALEVDPELRAAELKFNQDYAVAVGNGVTETVVLQQTAVFRRGELRWLLSPPDGEFWGAYQTNQSSLLALTYPERDKAIAERLAFDLEAKLNEMCRTLAELNCPDELRVYLRLSNELESLRPIEKIDTIAAGLRLELPTPTLVGLPVDEAGYQALYRGYAAQVVTAVIPQLVDYQCCEKTIFFQALLDYQLSQLGLRPWPVTPNDYVRVIHEDVTSSEMSLLWRDAGADMLSPPYGWQAYAVVDFLTQQYPETAVADMQRLIGESGIFTDWVERLPGTVTTLNENPFFFPQFLRDWRQYAYQQAVVNQEPPPIAYPEQDIYLFCLAEDNQGEADLFRLRLDTMEWQKEEMGSSGAFANPLPQDDGLLLQMIEGEGDSVGGQTSIWRNGVNEVLMDSDYISLGQFDPTGERMIAYAATEELGVVMVDMATCVDGDCLERSLDGLPVWSPDGSDYLFSPSDALVTNPFIVDGRIFLLAMEDMPLQEWPIYRGGDVPVTAQMDEMIHVATGYAPFWLDETTYGYVRQIPISSNSNDRELVLASTTDDTPRVLFSKADLLSFLSERGQLPDIDLDIRFVIPHPTEPDTFLVAAFGLEGLAYLFSYNLETDALNFAFQTDLGRYRSFGVSPDGRYLTLAETILDTSDRDRGEQLLLHDLVEDETQTFTMMESFYFPATNYDWSADSEWLVILLNDRDLMLTAPNYDYQQLIPHSLGECMNVVWLNR